MWADTRSTDMLVTLGHYSLLGNGWLIDGRYFTKRLSTYLRHLADVMADTLVEMLADMSIDASI